MMKVGNFIFSIVAVFAVFLAGCGLDVNDTRYIKGEGPIVSHIINVDTFSNIHHGSIGSMAITIGDTFTIELRAQQNIINEMVFFTENDIFYWGIQGDVQVSESDSISMNVQIPSVLNEVRLTGVGNISLDGPRQAAIALELQGVGNLLAYDLEVDKAQVFLSGSGNIQVYVTEELTGLLSGSGRIYYKGEPFINLPVTGAGNIINDN